MNKAMTLIEVLVVIAIMLIMMAVVMVYPSRSSADLDRAARQLASDIREAQNMAMSVLEQNQPSSGTIPTAYGVGVWGANPAFSTAYYPYYYYRDDLGWEYFYYNYYGDFKVDLPKGINITNPVGGKWIMFRVPDGAICIGLSNCTIMLPTTELSVDIILQASNGSTKTVTVTSAGKIEIQ